MKIHVSRTPLPNLNTRANTGASNPRFWSAAASALLALTLAVPWQVQAADTGATCRTTALVDILPNVIAPMAGQEPIWLVGANQARWRGDSAVNVAWVLSRRQEGPLIVTGHRRKSPSALSFASSDGSLSRVFQVLEPHSQSIVPKGADETVLKEYSFVMSSMVFPTPGCWEIEARLGNAARRIVVWVPNQVARN